MQLHDRAVTERLRDFARRPPPFSRCTAPEFWNDPRVSRELLKWHLDPDSDLASYRPERIDRAVAWLSQLVSLGGKRVCDLGCGPGLHASRMHDLGVPRASNKQRIGAMIARSAHDLRVPQQK